MSLLWEQESNLEPVVFSFFVKKRSLEKKKLVINQEI